MAIKISLRKLMDPPVAPNEDHPKPPDQISLAFHSMLLVKIHNYFSTIGDDCSKKFVEDLIVSAKYLNSPPNKSSSLKGGSGTNSESENNRRPPRRIRTHRLHSRGSRRVTSSKPLTEAELQFQLQQIHFENIKQESDGLTMQQYLSLLHDSATKAAIPAIFTKLILAFTIDSITGIPTVIAKSIKSSVYSVGDTGAQLVKGSVENVGVLNLAWNMMNLANNLVVKSSNFVFKPSQELTQPQVANYIKTVDQQTDSMIYNLTNFSFSTKVAGYIFLLWAIICYNYLLWVKRSEIVKKAKESQIVLYRLANDIRLQPPVDESLSNMWLGAVPAATGLGTMALFRDPALSLGVARMTDRVVNDYFSQKENEKLREISIYSREERHRQAPRNEERQRPAPRTEERPLPNIERVIHAQRNRQARSESRKRQANNSGSNAEPDNEPPRNSPPSPPQPKKKSRQTAR
jgi:hypothetical protein